ncbi:vWA domain-containing protein [Limnoglobus roseus]|uniref:vWA domain-containing protein n=1 Tax=Limnoglobus roseus TaxID=2598579 RepID=UPI0011EA730D|nr:VWA-like domain-containing protein [Limnoglobus roseus]
MTTAADPFAALEAEAAKQAVAEAAAKRLATARAKLILGRDAKSAFFATLALRLTSEVDWACGTMATDGRVLAYDPRFVTGLSPDELVGVLAHEVMHNALAHPFRRGARDPARWNEACDLAVNPLLLAAGFVLPASRFVPGEGTYAALPAGKSADEYYARLAEPPATGGPGGAGAESPRGDGGGPDPGGCGGVTEPAAGSPAAREQTAAAWQVAVVQAEQVAKGRGELPAGIARTVEAVRRPPVDWRAVLRAFVSATACNDYAWARPNRRFLWQGLYLPGLRSEELGDVVIAVDTSGSVGPTELAVFAGAVDDVLSAFDCVATVLYHDTEVQGVQTWRSGDGPLVLAPVGGGGTAHACVFDWLDRAGVSPACVVCLTDLETRFPDRPPGVPVLWAVVGDNTSPPPFGTSVRVTAG